MSWGPPTALTASAAPALPSGAVRLGELPAASTMSIDVTLNLPNEAALNAYIADLSNRASPLFDHFLQPGQFGPMFGPSLTQVAAVENALRSAGLSPGQVTSNRLSIPVTATVAAIEHAFGIDLVSYRLPGGRVAFANSSAPKLPAAIAPLVTGVLGLDNLYQMQSNADWSNGPAAQARAGAAAGDWPAVATATTVGPQPCAAAKAVNANFGTNALTANQLAAHYGMASLYSLGDFGQGVRIALIELEPDSNSDINAYKSCYGLSTTINYIKVDGGVGSGTGSGEAALDIEDVAGLAPKSTIDVYQAPNGTDKNIFDDYNKIATSDTDKVVSTSWGLCEAYSNSADAQSAATVFLQMNTQRQTVFAAAGDSGSTGCQRNGGPDAAKLNVQTPSSTPTVVAVGGTSINHSTGAESVWNDSSSQNGSGGGGISQLWCMDPYQYQTAIPGLINSHSKTNSGCAAAKAHNYIRQVPDVSADADPFTGYVVIIGGHWQPVGGTSAAAPLWAAIAALTDASPFCADYGSGPAGVLAEGLYFAASKEHTYIYPTSTKFADEVLYDVTKGNNDYTPSGYTGGLYPATRGYDEASGLGAPLVTGVNLGKWDLFFPGVAAMMCKVYSTKLGTIAVSSVTPNHGLHGHTQKVTVKGKGFLPIAGTDLALVDGKLLAAKCTSTTVCTVTLPALAKSTVNVQMEVEDFGPSAVTTADRYTYT